MLAERVTRIGDAMTALTHGGSPAMAVGVQRGAAATMIAGSLALLSGARRTEAERTSARRAAVLAAR